MTENSTTLKNTKEQDLAEASKMISQALNSIKLSCHYITVSAGRIAIEGDQIIAAMQLESLAKEMDKLAKWALREGGN